jgi:hypothetical protein
MKRLREISDVRRSSDSSRKERRRGKVKERMVRVSKSGIVGFGKEKGRRWSLKGEETRGVSNAKRYRER